MRVPKWLRVITGTVFVCVLAVAAYLTHPHWVSLLFKPEQQSEHEEDAPVVDEPKILKLSPQARKNLGLVSKPAIASSYWRKIQVPGEIVDRPGRSDRGVTAPAVGVVTQIHSFPGDTVRPGDTLFTIRLFSEYLQNTQKQYFSSTREIEFIDAELNRIRPLAERGGVPKTRVIDLENQRRRQLAVIQAHRQDLLTRGLTPELIENVATGKFVASINVVAPSFESETVESPTVQQAVFNLAEDDSGLAYEVQELNAELGQQVQAGQLLSTLANHSSLYIEGHAFKKEAPHLEKAAHQSWPVAVEFAEDAPDHWPKLEQQFEIRYLSNSIDPVSRTFGFFIPLRNQSRFYKKRHETFVVWRFRPGQHVRLFVPVEEMTNIFVLPSSAVVREGPEAYVFQQNGDLFNRLAVHVLHEDRTSVIIANDGSVTPGLYLAQSSAASLNRVLKAQSASGMRADVHVHADGTVHANH